MFSKSLEFTLNLVFSQAREKNHEFITIEHLLLALLDNPEASQLLVMCGANLERLRTGLTIFINETTPHGAANKLQDTQPTLGFQRVLQRAIFQVQSAGKMEVTGVNALAAIFSEQESQSVYFLSQENVTRLDVINYISHGITKFQQQSDGSEAAEQGGDAGGMGMGPQESMLVRYTTNLNELALAGKIDPLIGRQDLIQRTAQVLCRRHKNNPLLVGEAGVGKTAIAEGLAQLIVEGKAPDPIKHSIIYALDLGILLAGTKYRGDFEKRFKGMLKELKQTPGAIVFIDEVHTLIGAGAASGGTIDASNLLKPLLTNGDIRCMGSTTYQEYRNIFEKDRALARRFQKIDVPEPTIEQAYQMLRGLKTRFENYHGVHYTQAALKSAVELTARYITDRFLPDKAIDVIDEAGARQTLLPVSKRKKLIGRHEIEEVLTNIARIPSKTLTSSDKENLRYLERNLKMLVFGQDQAIASLSAAIKLSRSGLRDASKPIGSFLFAGPTGVGKTEVTKQLAKLLGIELLRFDMSEYMERHTVSRLIGAPPGYVGYDQGGLLTEAVIKHPHAVLLLDEVEKAHPDIFNLLLQVMDYGHLMDNNGRTADFRHVVVIMTTNVGADTLEKTAIGFSEQDTQSDGGEAIKHLFPPEFRNRLDAVIQFSHLDEHVINRVADKFLMELEVQLQEKGVTLEVDDNTKRWLVTHGYDHKMGARPMARLIEDKIKRPLADELLFGRLTRGGAVHISEKDNLLHFNVECIA